MLDLRCVCVMLVSACGGSQKPASSGDCEPGRCLEDVSTAIQPHRPEARACYDAKPGLPSGRIIMNFEIDREGAIAEPTQSMKDGQLEDAVVVACIGGVLKGIKFAPSAAGTTTRAYHVFEFTSRTSPKS